MRREGHYEVGNEVEALWENGAAISLSRPRTPLVVTRLHYFALEAAVSTFKSGKVDHPGLVFPEVIVMEYGF